MVIGAIGHILERSIFVSFTLDNEAWGARTTRYIHASHNWPNCLTNELCKSTETLKYLPPESTCFNEQKRIQYILVIRISALPPRLIFHVTPREPPTDPVAYVNNVIKNETRGLVDAPPQSFHTILRNNILLLPA